MISGVNHTKAKIIGMAAVLSAFAPVGTHAQTTISNTATIAWDAGSSRAGQTSNRVDIPVRPAPPIGQPKLTTFHLADSQGGGSPLSVPTTMCQTGSGMQEVTVTGVFAGVDLNPASVKPATSIRAGEPLIVTVDSALDNRDVMAVDTLTITLSTPGGDAETLRLQETGANTGKFVGVIRTAAIPPTPVQSDCVLSVRPGDNLNLSGLRFSDGTLIANAPLDILIDPFGIVFDSGDGKPVQGSRVTLINADSGQPAQVFGDDGVSSFPATVITGSTVTDGSGAQYIFPEGDYRFPFVRAGNYRLLVEPPAPYIAPSLAAPTDLAGLRRPDGLPFTIVDGSYSLVFRLSDPAPVRIDIPVDRPGGALILTKSASQPAAVAGDGIQYRITVRNGDGVRTTGAITVTDLLPPEMRLRENTVRYNGALISYTVTPDGGTLTVPVRPLSGGQSGVITYLLEVRPDAKPGITLNRAVARDNRGVTSPIADAAVRITRDGLGDRMTIIGRITDGGCKIPPESAQGLGGVRVMLQDGSYAVTDNEGRYHFEGVLPGLNVVQFDPSTLPAGQVPQNCTQNARAGGSAISRFVEGQGGSLIRVDFRSAPGENLARLDATVARRAAPIDDAVAAGAQMDWFADQTPEVKWLFPAPDHNPRTKAVRIAIKHLPGQTVTLLANGEPVNAYAFDGTKKNGLESVAVSVWRGVELPTRVTVFTAQIKDANGTVVETLSRSITYSGAAIRAEMIRDKSILVADGVTRPVIALRMTDRDGHPIQHGVVGDFAVAAPYYPAVAADAQAALGLAGLERGKPAWRVEGDDGVAYIELEPTTASGGLSITLPFRDGDVTRKQQVELWLSPGKRPWTVVGFAAGTLGFNTLKGRLEGLGADGDRTYTDARIALYAKGRIKGQWLMTMSYDSDKAKDDTRFGGVIDPTAYYTIYADQSERRYDAASVRKLYLKLERPQFYALFGDYETGINEPVLTRYSRAFNGVKSEFRNDNVSASAFAADTPYRNRREELQGNGLTGPYALSARDVLANSERVTLETRDRLRSERIVETRVLVRHIDYDIVYASGTLRFREPILSRSSGLDPQFIVVTYEVDGVAQRVLNAGGRVAWTNDAKNLTIGTTAIHNEDDQAKTNVGGIDLKYQPTPQSEVRAEFAVSDATARNGVVGATAGTSTAWLVEAEHHGAKYDILAYARQQEAGYGVGQLNRSEIGTRKFGFDGRARLTEQLSILGSAWQEDDLGSTARRQAGRVLGEYRSKALDMRAGLTIANDTLVDGRTAQSTIGQFGATKRLLNGKLELDAQTEVPLSSSESIDFPARHKLSARYAVSNDVSVVAGYELAKGDTINARTARIGFDVKPWQGARLIASANSQRADDYGPRTYAAFGLAQSLPVNEKLTVDFTLDGNKTLGSVDRSRVLNPARPVASGGFIGTDGTLGEDFTAVTAGASYRSKVWSLTGRAEYRDGETTNRYGFNMAALRQIGEGRAFGGALSWYRAQQAGGAQTETAALALSWANRPDNSRLSILNKLELRSDKVFGAVIGRPGPIGGAPLTVQGDAKSQRVINSLALNWSPTERRDGEFLNRSEVSVFWGSRYSFDKIDADELKGWSNVVGADIRFDLSKTIDLGVSGTVRQNPGGKTYAYSGGPTASISPAKNTYITVGYNVVGFKDRDFEASRYTRKGPFVTLRLKFDQDSFARLGLGSRKLPEARTKAEPIAMTPMPTEASVDEAAPMMSAAPQMVQADSAAAPDEATCTKNEPIRIIAPRKVVRSATATKRIVRRAPSRSTVALRKLVRKNPACKTDKIASR
jgi:uncharacterized repeat protein (TIGR01451 family)